jgi:hypothetical protein
MFGKQVSETTPIRVIGLLTEKHVVCKRLKDVRLHPDVHSLL